MKIREHTESEVYKKSFDAAMAIFLATKKFPKDETYSLIAGFGARLARFVQIWQRRGASGAIAMINRPQHG